MGQIKNSTIKSIGAIITNAHQCVYICQCVSDFSSQTGPNWNLPVGFRTPEPMAHDWVRVRDPVTGLWPELNLADCVVPENRKIPVRTFRNSFRLEDLAKLNFNECPKSAGISTS
jgi:hypothetical protein